MTDKYKKISIDTRKKFVNTLNPQGFNLKQI